MNRFKSLAAMAAVLAMTCLWPTGAAAQADAPPTTLSIDPRANGVLPAATEIPLVMDADLSTKGGKLALGQTFGLTVARDIRIGDYVIIPRGTPATGEVMFLTGKGAFGKSGKLAVILRHIVLNGRQIPLTGTYRQDGQGNSMATAAGVGAVGVFAGIITGHSGVIPKGRQLMAYLRDPLPVAFPPMVIAQPAP